MKDSNNILINLNDWVEINDPVINQPWIINDPVINQTWNNQTWNNQTWNKNLQNKLVGEIKYIYPSELDNIYRECIHLKLLSAEYVIVNCKFVRKISELELMIAVLQQTS